GVLILISAVINFINIGSDDHTLFADWGQLRQVMSVLTPTAIYVALVPYIGIYVASVILIAVFMRWLGRYDWGTVALISVGVPLITFFVFEDWFLVPLPTGPV